MSRTAFVASCLIAIQGCPINATEQPNPPAARTRPIPTVDFHIPWMGMKNLRHAR